MSIHCIIKFWTQRSVTGINSMKDADKNTGQKDYKENTNLNIYPAIRYTVKVYH